ncbi:MULTISPECIES: DUF6933 domain-containing protein [Salimicrobium]|uniref:DUF6933 domain-containing protein n=3 Tax=Salimicrobium TaxID=351195 RepID=K2FLL7_9BACI|nr:MULTISPECIES: hypothetical protein [Salimicrobium]AKG03613.1 hypothetical protein AAV35_001645 [Salimicrobium jeotgali]EKE31896.1 hypothetical protein MJ3_05808 [Salimicrobium jeotgali]MBM7696079.1 hypothetical protein [Salimicrobium jeotgali]SDX84137.1 hypothetical protein SAMN04488081_1449 [Salimicrobium album]SIS80306.1 hypothetical protein SAMN05421758_10635 [Salimicrobium salexigens]
MFTIGVTEKMAESLPMEREEFDKRDLPEIYRWQMNRFSVRDKEGLLLMNDRTALTLVLFGLEAEQYENIDNVLRGSLKQLLQMLDINEEYKRDLLDNSKKIILTKTDNRRTLGRMKESLKLLEGFTEEREFEEIDAVEVNRWMNENMVFSTLANITPIKELNDYYENNHGQ